MSGSVLTEEKTQCYNLEDGVTIQEIPKGTRQVEVWVPFVQSDEHQRVLGVEVEAPFPMVLHHDREWGNAILYGHLPSPQGSISFKVRYEVMRRPNRLTLDPSRVRPLAGQEWPFLRSLLPERFVRVDSEISDLAKEVVGEETNPLRQAKALYDYVTGTMKYDATQQSFKGSTDHALSCQIGNCNDIHALYISFARAVQIPSRLVMGFALEELQAGQCEVCGYHCWAESYLPGLGWIPVDASCACKYGHAGFGTLDLNHVAFSRGRDLLLEPPQRGERLLFFPSAYVEVDGVKHDRVERHLTFHPL